MTRPVGRWRRADERGDTLLEVLFTIVVVSITSVALLMGFSSSISGSSSDRKLVSSDVALRTVAESVFSQVQQQPTNPLYNPCLAPNSTYNSASWGAPAGYTATVTVVGDWSSTTQTWASPPSSCAGSSIPQKLMVTVRQPNGTVATSYVVVNRIAPGASPLSITSVNPASLTPGTSNLYVVITGTGFTSTGTGTTAVFSSTPGSGNPSPGVTFTGTGSASSPASSPTWVVNSSTSIPAEVNVAAAAPTGSGVVTLTLTNPDGATASTTLSVSSGPVITLLNPSTILPGSNNVALAITGTNFQSGATVTFQSSSGGTCPSTPPGTGNSATSISTTIDGPAGTPPGQYWVTVANPDGQVSPQYPFTVSYPPPTIIAVSDPNDDSTCQVTFSGHSDHVVAHLRPRDHGNKNTQCTITGTNFYPTVGVTIAQGSSGNGCLPSFATSGVTLSSITLTFSPNPNCTVQGSYNVTVTAAGGSVSAPDSIVFSTNGG